MAMPGETGETVAYDEDAEYLTKLGLKQVKAMA